MLLKYVKATFFTLLLFFGIRYSQAGSPDSLTLDNAIRMAIDNYPSIKAATSSVAAADAQIIQSRSGYLPTVEGIADYARLDPVSEFTLPDIGTMPLFPANNYDFHVGARQILYDFGRRSAAVENAKSGKASAFENVESIKAGLAYQVVDVFYSILYLQENEEVLKKQIAALEEHLDITRKRLQAGTVTDFEVLTTQVRIANTRNQIIDNSTALANQKSILRAMTGINDNGQLNIIGNFYSDSLRLNSDSLKALALNNLPELKLSHNAERTAETQYRLASLGDRPSLAASITFGYKNGYTPDLDKLKANWVGALEIQAPIFNGFLTHGRKTQAEANLNAAKYRTQDLERRAISGVEQVISNVMAARERLATSEPQVAQAEQALSMAQARYKAGTATNLDLLDAETALANARLVRLKAMYDLTRNQYALKKAVGEIIW